MLSLAFSWGDVARGLVLVGFLAVCLLMVLTVLIQKPQGGGLASAFGGGAAGSGQTAFGTKTGDALTIFTIIVFVVYLAFAVILNFTTRPTAAASSTTEVSAPEKAPANAPNGQQPNAPAAPAPTPADKKPDATQPGAPPANPTTNPSTPGAAPANPAPAPSNPEPTSPAPAPSNPEPAPGNPPAQPENPGSSPSAPPR
jgi:preprotein translocase subunit SecG